jgi:hypothetical protein
MSALLLPGTLLSEPVTVRYLEGSLQGFLALHSSEGKLLASGDLTQVVRGDRVVSHLVFRFRDGSLDDEMTTFSQHGSFKLISDHHIQKGPIFPKPMDMLIDVPTGKVIVRYEEKGKSKVDTEQMDLPNDLANGVIFDIVKNLAPDARDSKLSWIAATPKPRLVKLSLSSMGAEKFSVAGFRYKSIRYQVKVEFGGLAGLVAPLIGKEPPVISVWIATGAAPAFVKLEGPLFLSGPVWKVEMASPVW